VVNDEVGKTLCRIVRAGSFLTGAVLVLPDQLFHVAASSTGGIACNCIAHSGVKG
jgi:hypothetical protein